MSVRLQRLRLEARLLPALPGALIAMVGMDETNLLHRAHRQGLHLAIRHLDLVEAAQVVVETNRPDLATIAETRLLVVIVSASGSGSAIEKRLESVSVSESEKETVTIVVGRIFAVLPLTDMRRIENVSENGNENASEMFAIVIVIAILGEIEIVIGRRLEVTGEIQGKVLLSQAVVRTSRVQRRRLRLCLLRVLLEAKA